MAVFDKRDHQQLMIMRHMAYQFALPIDIVPAETVRADDGLTLSSRSVHLTSGKHAETPGLYRTLHQVRRDVLEAVLQGQASHGEIIAKVMNYLRDHGWQSDYVVACRCSDLQKLAPGNTAADEPLVVLTAAKPGKTRLVDSLEI